MGITLSDSNALVLILAMTAVFNALQFLFVSVVSYVIVRLPQVRNTRVAGRRLWIINLSPEARTRPVTLSQSAARRGASPIRARKSLITSSSPAEQVNDAAVG